MTLGDFLTYSIVTIALVGLAFWAGYSVDRRK